jgi:hypothetical protein
MGEIFFDRTVMFWYHFDILFRLSPIGRKFHKNLAILHGFTWSVIRTRKKELLVRSKHQTEEEVHEDLSK